jgi:hypothetical protein
MIASISTEVSEHPVLRHTRKKKKLCHSLHEHKQIINILFFQWRAFKFVICTELLLFLTYASLFISKTQILSLLGQLHWLFLDCLVNVQSSLDFKIRGL